MGGLMKALIAIVALALLGWFCIYHDAPRIEADILSNARDELGVALDSDGIMVDGRDVTLTGEVGSQAELDSLVSRAAGLNGVRRVNNQLSVVVPVVVAPYVTVVEKLTDELVISGEMPDEATREQLRNDTAAIDETLPLGDTSEIRAAPPEGWVAALQSGIDALGRLDTGRITVTDDRLLVEGVVPSEAVRAGIDATLASAGLMVDSQIEVNAPPPAQQVLNCQAMFNDALAGEKILFATSSATIAERSMTLLDRLARIARRCPDVRIEVAGHTDSRGDAAFNQRLSEQRAAAVGAALRSRGLSADRIEAAGYGEARPRAVNATAAGREENRRIEITVTAN